MHMCISTGSAGRGKRHCSFIWAKSQHATCSMLSSQRHSCAGLHGAVAAHTRSCAVCVACSLRTCGQSSKQASCGDAA